MSKYNDILIIIAAAIYVAVLLYTGISNWDNYQ